MLKVLFICFIVIVCKVSAEVLEGTLVSEFFSGSQEGYEEVISAKFNQMDLNDVYIIYSCFLRLPMLNFY